MTNLEHRHWVPDHCENLVGRIAATTSQSDASCVATRLAQLIEQNQHIHERECFNLNPATNVMNPRAEAALAQRLGSRPSLGYPGDKYEMGLEAIEEIEVIAAALAADVFDARFAEIRVPSGALANLYGFMAICAPGDAIIVPPATIGGHVTHHRDGCAGLYHLDIHAATIAADGYTLDLDALALQVRSVKPKLITVGGSLNLYPHPVADIRALADEVGAKVLFDAAHQCGIIAGRAWPNPLSEGAHLMTMSTYKSLGGPAGGLIVSNDTDLMEKIDAIAFPGMTANFDAAKSAALAYTLLDWKTHGVDYAKTMVNVAVALADALHAHQQPVFRGHSGFTQSHQFALDATRFGGGQTLSKALRRAGFLACGIGLPLPDVAGDLNGLRLGTPELVRWGITETHVPKLAELLARALDSQHPETLADEVSAFRAEFNELHFIVKN